MSVNQNNLSPINKQDKMQEIESNLSLNDTKKTIDKVALAQEKQSNSKLEWIRSNINFSIPESPSLYPICALKQKGVSHIYKGTNCQDAYAFETDKEFTILAIADGHGDKKHDLSEYGSQIATDELCKLVKETIKNEASDKVIDFLTSHSFKSQFLNKWIAEIQKDYVSRIKSDQLIDLNTVKIRYGTTLLFTIAYKEFIVLGQLGDGGIILVDGNNKAFLHIPYGIKIGSATSSLCLDNAAELIYTKSYFAKDYAGVCLMTDGYYDPWVTKPEDIYSAAVFFIKSFSEKKYMKNAVELIYQIKLNEAVEFASDDITIGVMSINNNNESHKIDIEEVIRINSEGFCITKEKNNKPCIGVYSSRLKKVVEPKDTNIIPEHTSILKPIGKHKIFDNREIILFEKLSSNYCNIDELYQNPINRKILANNVKLTLTLVKNILQLFITIDKKTIVPFLLLSDCIQFSVINGNLKLYWAFFEIERLGSNHDRLASSVAKYIINLIFAKKIYYYEEQPINGQNQIILNDIEDNSQYPKNYIELLFDISDQRKSKNLEDLLDSTNKLLEHTVQCSKCEKSTILIEKKGKCVCGNEFEIFGNLTNSQNNLSSPLSANTSISLFDEKTESYQKVFEIIKENDRIGFKNISTKDWFIFSETGEKNVVTTNKIANISKVKSLLINDVELLIKPRNKGENNE